MLDWPAGSCPPRARIYDPWRLDDDGSASTPVEPSHNRWRLTVQNPATVSAGAVTAFPRIPAGDGGAGVIGGQVGTVAYNVDGGQLVGEWAPGERREFVIELSGYVGTGAVVAQLETWSDLPWR